MGGANKSLHPNGILSGAGDSNLIFHTGFENGSSHAMTLNDKHEFVEYNTPSIVAGGSHRRRTGRRVRAADVSPVRRRCSRIGRDAKRLISPWRLKRRRVDAFIRRVQQPSNVRRFATGAPHGSTRSVVHT